MNRFQSMFEGIVKSNAVSFLKQEYVKKSSSFYDDVRIIGCDVLSINENRASYLVTCRTLDSTADSVLVGDDECDIEIGIHTVSVSIEMLRNGEKCAVKCKKLKETLCAVSMEAGWHGDY